MKLLSLLFFICVLVGCQTSSPSNIQSTNELQTNSENNTAQSSQVDIVKPEDTTRKNQTKQYSDAETQQNNVSSNTKTTIDPVQFSPQNGQNNLSQREKITSLPMPQVNKQESPIETKSAEMTKSNTAQIKKPNTTPIVEPKTTKVEPIQRTTKNNDAAIQKIAKQMIKASQSLSSKSNVHPAEALASFDFDSHLKFLVQKNAKDDRNYNMLMLAGERGYTDIVRSILQVNSQSSSVNQVSSDGGKKTALINAVDLGYVEIVQLLVVNGADKDMRRKDGKTALELAQFRYSGSSGSQKENYKKIIAILQGTQRY